MRQLLLLISLVLVFFFSQLVARAENDEVKVIDWTKEANEALEVIFSDPQAADIIPLLAMGYEGERTEQDLADLVDSTREAAKKGDPKAKVRLSMMYRIGMGVSKNDVEAFRWVASAAEDGYRFAEFLLSGMYNEGRGTRQSRIEAAKWLKKAKDHGSAIPDGVFRCMEKTEWRKTDGAFEAILGLFDRSGTEFSSQNRAPNGDVENGRLVLAPGETADAFIKYINCSHEGSGGCSEVVDVAVFRPDWTMVREVRDLKLRKDAASPEKDGYTFADFWFSLIVEDSDPPGLYHLLVDIYDGKQKLRVGLSTAFSVAKRAAGTSEANVGRAQR